MQGRALGVMSDLVLIPCPIFKFFNFQDRECREAAKRYERVHPTHHIIYIIITKTLLVWAGGIMLKHCHLTPRIYYAYIYTCVDSTRLWVLHVCTDVLYHACLQHTPVSSRRDNPQGIRDLELVVQADLLNNHTLRMRVYSSPT